MMGTFRQDVIYKLVLSPPHIRALWSMGHDFPFPIAQRVNCAIIEFCVSRGAVPEEEVLGLKREHCPNLIEDQQS